MLFENISRLCAEKGVSFCALERTLNLGNGSIGKWGKENRSPRLDSVKRIADFFGVTVDDLLRNGDTST